MHPRVAAASLLATLALGAPALAQTSPARQRRRALTASQETPPAWRRLAMFRAMMGAANIRGAGADASTQWALDLHAGVRLLDGSRRGAFWIFGGDVGVSFGPRGAEMETLWLGGPSVSYGGVWLSIGYAPRFVLGSVQQQTALGLRNTLSVCAFLGVVCADVAHQYLSMGEGSQQDIRLGMGLDLGMIAQLLVQFAEARPG